AGNGPRRQPRLHHRQVDQVLGQAPRAKLLPDHPFVDSAPFEDPGELGAAGRLEHVEPHLDPVVVDVQRELRAQDPVVDPWRVGPDGSDVGRRPEHRKEGSREQGHQPPTTGRLPSIDTGVPPAKVLGRHRPPPSRVASTRPVPYLLRGARPDVADAPAGRVSTSECALPSRAYAKRSGGGRQRPPTGPRDRGFSGYSPGYTDTTSRARMRSNFTTPSTSENRVSSLP